MKDFTKQLLGLTVVCPVCDRSFFLKPSRFKGDEFTAEMCDGSFGARHSVVTALGPKGRPDA